MTKLCLLFKKRKIAPYIFLYLLSKKNVKKMGAR